MLVWVKEPSVTIGGQCDTRTITTPVSCFQHMCTSTGVEEGWVVGHRPVIVKRAVIGSKGGCKLSTIFLSYKVFHDWSIIKLGNILYLLDGYIFAILFKQHLIVFVDLVYWCGLEKRTLHSGIFSVEFSSHVGCPLSGAKKW